jgi:hypothetical protein
MDFRHAVPRLVGPLAFGAAGLLGTTGWAQTMYGPTPYLCSDDSPFAGGSFTYFYLETFEDHLLNVPGVTPSAGGVTSVIFGPSIHDSVDCDDGVVDGSGLQGDSFFVAGANVTFRFDAAVLGSLPTTAGIVWTDGAQGTDVVFDALDESGAVVGTVSARLGDGGNNGGTEEDRFFGVEYAAGLSAVRIRHSAGGLEVAHLQYGRSGPPPCTADFNGDGFLDFFDYDDYVLCFETGVCPPGRTADVNGDGFADFFDYDDFVAAFEVGC